MPEVLTDERIEKNRALMKRHIFREIRRVYKKAHEENGISQKEIATKLSADPGLVSRKLKGQENLTLNSIADLFLAIGARLEFKGSLFSEIEKVSECLLIGGSVTKNTHMMKETVIGPGALQGIAAYFVALESIPLMGTKCIGVVTKSNYEIVHSGAEMGGMWRKLTGEGSIIEHDCLSSQVGIAHLKSSEKAY